MKAATFDYVRPRSLAEAAGALARNGYPKLIAGGQSLGPLLNLRLIRPTMLIDISRVEELHGIDETSSGWRIGAGVTHAQLEDASLPGCEMMTRVAGEISYRSVRSRGTIGGSLAHADPAGDWGLVLPAIGARVVVRTPNGKLRAVAADSFATAAFTTVLEPAEIVVAIEVDRRSPEARCGYFKFCRKAGDYPEVSAAVVHDPRKSEARVFVGALATEPRPLPNVAELLARGDQAAFEVDAIMTAIAAAVPEMDTVELRMRVAAVQQALAQVRQA